MNKENKKEHDELTAIEEARGDYISFNPKRFKQFKQMYKICRDRKIDSFIFNGKEILTDYAKYLIMHLETVFKEAK